MPRANVLADDYRDLVCSLHRGLVEGMLSGLKPKMTLRDFKPFAERGICKLAAGLRGGAADSGDPGPADLQRPDAPFRRHAR